MYKTSVPIAIQSISDTETEKDTSLIDSLRAYFYSALTAVFAMVFFLITSGGEFNFNGAVLIYSAFFAVFYIMAMVGTVRAVDYGELSVTTLINQCSLIITTMFGLIVLKESFGILRYVGIVLLGACLFPMKVIIQTLPPTYTI